MVLPSGAALVRSFVFNVLRLSDPDDLDEAVHAMQPGPAAGISWTPLHVIPAWTPHGAPTRAGHNVALREALETSTLAAGGSFTVGAAHALDLTWAEEVLAVRGLDDATAARLAAGHGQPVFLRPTACGCTYCWLVPAGKYP